MLTNIVPNTITPEVLRLRDRINPDSVPIFVPIEPSAEAIKQECFPNVIAHVEKYGGRAITGWSVGSIPGILIEGEFHCVWETPQGNFVDITPVDSRSGLTLFIPDPASSYSGGVENNIRLPLSNDQLILDFIAGNEILYRIWNTGEEKFQRGYTQDELDSKQQLLDPVYKQLALIGQMLHLGKNQKSPCECGSTLNYLACHGRTFMTLKRRYLA